MPPFYLLNSSVGYNFWYTLSQFLHCFRSIIVRIGSQPRDHYFRSVCWFVCLFVCAVFLSSLWSDFDQTWTYVICLGL